MSDEKEINLGEKSDLSPVETYSTAYEVSNAKELVMKAQGKDLC